MAVFTVEQRGVGKPDYSKEISLGQIRPGVRLKYNQFFVIGGVTFSDIPSPYSWIKAPLASGATSHFVDYSTGLDTPYSLPAGYLLNEFQHQHSMTQDHRVLIYFDTVYVGNLGTSESGKVNFLAGIAKMTSAIFDPTAASAHLFDLVIENLGGADMEGSDTVHIIIEAVGTSLLPKDKTVKCKWCGHKWVTPKETTAINCPSCGNLNIYCDFSRLRSLG